MAREAVIGGCRKALRWHACGKVARSTMQCAVCVGSLKSCELRADHPFLGIAFLLEMEEEGGRGNFH